MTLILSGSVGFIIYCRRFLAHAEIMHPTDRGAIDDTQTNFNQCFNVRGEISFWRAVCRDCSPRGSAPSIRFVKAEVFYRK